MAEKSNKKATGAPELPKQTKPDKEKESVDAGLESKQDTSQPEAEAKTEITEPDTPKTGLEDKQTDEAVEDIIRKESDELLEAQDSKAVKTEPLGRRPWWKRAWLRWTLLVTALAAIGLIIFPTTRYWILNTLGVRVSASVEVVDNTTGQPLKNVTISIDSSQATTGADGKATVEKVKLGPGTLKLERIAFASQEKQVVLGLGSNPLGRFEMQAVGTQYTVIVRDYASNLPIEGAEASSGQAAARSDNTGKLVLTLDKSDGSDVTVTLAAPGYRSEEVTLKAAAENEALLVPSAKEVFVTKESGKYDVYAMDVDGKNKKVLLPGTGLESGNIALAVSPDGERVALVSTRDNVRTADGRLLNTLTLINAGTGDTLVLDRGEQIQLMDWIGSRIVYHMVANVAADAADRNRINSYDYKADSRAQLGTANQIRSAASALGTVYYTDGANYFRTAADGKDRQAVLDKEVWASYRTAYDELNLQTPTGWYKLTPSSGAIITITEPSQYASHIFVTNQAAKHSLWIEKSSLQLYDNANAKSTGLHTQDGLTYPVRWLTDTVGIFRVANGQEIADYVIGSQGGTPRKLGNVTGTFGINPAF